MKKIIFNNLKLVAIGLVLVVGVSYVYAGTFNPRPTGTPIENYNTDPVVNVSTKQQVKSGGLTVDAFEANKNAEVDGETYFQGILRGGNQETNTDTDPSTPSNIAFGGDDPTNLTIRHLVDMVVNGGIAVNQTITTNSLTSGQISKVCATPDGTLVLCSTPHVGLVANPTTVNSGGSSTLTVDATGFQGSINCSIDNGVGTVVMSNIGASWSGNATANNITTTTTYTVTCTGGSGTGTAQATVTPQVISGSVTFTCPAEHSVFAGNGNNVRDARVHITLDRAISSTIRMNFAECDDGAGGYYAKVCFGSAIIPGGDPTGYQDVDGINPPSNLQSIWTITIPANTTVFDSPVPWLADNYATTRKELSCISNGQTPEQTSVPNMAYVRLNTPAGWTLQFKGTAYQPDPSKTKSFPVYQVP